jgi:hypothetical protein
MTRLGGGLRQMDGKGITQKLNLSGFKNLTGFFMPSGLLSRYLFGNEV